MIRDCCGRDDGRMCRYGLFFDEHVWIDDHFEHPPVGDEGDDA